MAGFLPTTLESITTVGANLAVMAGGASLTWAVIFKLDIALRLMGRRTGAEEALAAQKLAADIGPRPSDATTTILQTIIAWQAAYPTYARGLTDDEYKILSSEKREEYDLWVSRLTAAIDLVLLDANAWNQPKLRPIIVQELRKHMESIRARWPGRYRFPVSALMKSILGDIAAGRADRVNA